MWTHFFQDGGWGMYPTSLFGFLLIAAEVMFVLRPQRRWIPLVAALAGVTLGAGLLGTSVGIITTFRYLPQVARPQQFEIATLGCAESLHNLVLALMIVVFSGLIFALGALRAGFATRADTRSA